MLKRILFLLPQLKQGGAERVVLNLIRGIDRGRFMPYIAWFHGEALYPFSELHDIPLLPLDKHDGFDIKTMFKLYTIIKRHRINLVNPHHFMPLFYVFPSCQLNKARIVYTEHSVWEAAQVSGIWRRISRMLLMGSDAVVGVSPEVAAFLQKEYSLPERKVQPIVNGIDTQLFAPGRRNNHFRRMLGLEDGHTAIGMTGNFRRVKNHAFLVSTFALIVSRFPNARLVLIGQGFSGDPENTEREIHALVSKYGIADKVLFLGYRDDVAAVLACLDIFCLTSLKEGLPLSLIEAMACGLPVVGTNVDGIRVVIDSGRNGFLVEIGDTGELGRVLIELLTDKHLRDRMGREGRNDAERYYSLARFSSQYNQLFASLV